MSLKFKNKLRYDFVQELSSTITIKKCKYVDSWADKIHNQFPIYNKKDLKKFLLEFFKTLLDEMLYDNRVSLGSIHNIELNVKDGQIKITGLVKKSVLGERKNAKQRLQH
jgi:hypothetical protein